MKASYTYDLLEVNGNTSINWKDVLAVYAVRTTSSENPLEVVTLDDTKIDILQELLGKMGKETIITPPFWCDYGYNITVGDYFYSNHGMIITDGAKVTFGDNVFIAPNCCFTTAEHAIDPEMRKAGVEIAKPITVGNNVWIGAGSTILAGVEIGDNTVIGAGSVVTKSIPSNVVAVGVPCKVIREITQEDKTSYPMYVPKQP